MRILIVCLVLSSISFAAWAQVADVHADTSASVVVLEGEEYHAGSRTPKSPAVAISLSAVLPGAGQIYNGSYWKVPLIWGIGGFFIYAIVTFDDLYKDYRQRFRESITGENPLGNQQFLINRNFYRDQRDRFAWYMGFLYLLNLLDAYVDASLSAFDVGDDLSLRILPEVKPDGHASVRFQIRF